jgi:hypothetical protein
MSADITECQYIGSEQKQYPFTVCGDKLFPGRSYCEQHLWTVYKKGTDVNGKRKVKEIEKELAELKRIEEIEEIINA